MSKYWQIITESYSNYYHYFITEMTSFSPHNYFWGLIVVSLFFYSLELARPWRKNQPKIRKDFWLDAFYMFFNFFLFSLIGFYALSNIFVEAFNEFLGLFGISNLVAISVASWPHWLQLVVMFFLRDFIQFNVHRLLHRSPRLWEFHKVHHSVEQMGFAAQMRYHWMENIVYRTIEYVPLGMIGFGIQDFFLVYMTSFAIGHFNHANFTIPLGPFKYFFNNPEMHIWHHSKELPRPYGVNFGISLSMWDYLFKTNYIPYNGRDIVLGYDGDEDMPDNFGGQFVFGFKKKAT